MLNIACWSRLIYYDFEGGILLGLVGNFPIIIAFITSLLANYYKGKTVDEINDYFQNYVDIK